MVLVAGLDRLEGTKVGPWLTDAEWQDHKGQKSARPREARAARGPPVGKTIDPTKVFVTGLSVDAGQGDYLLREHCSSVGEVASVELLMRGYNGTVPTGSAIVQFYSAASATAAIQDLNGTELDGRRLYVRAYFT